MAWIEVHQSLFTHRKTLTLAEQLSIDTTAAAGYMIRLWSWAIDNSTDGNLISLSNKVIATAAGWKKSADKFVLAAVNSGFLDEIQDGYQIHDWYEYAGKLIDRRKANAERMRRKRAANVQNTCNARAGATVQYSTVPNSTVYKSSSNTQSDIPNCDDEVSEIIKLFAENHGQANCTPAVAGLIADWYEQAGGDVVRCAIEYAAKQGRKPFAYIEKIIIDWYERGLKTKADIEQYQKGVQRGNDKGTTKPQGNRPKLGTVLE